jgi:hypothetical protein
LETIQKNISTFISSQFPAQYREGGEAFIEFVKAYYKWLEGSQIVENVSSVQGTISIQAQNNIVVGTNTLFTTDLLSGQPIAIFKDNERYDIYTVKTVANDLLLTVDENPNFTNASTTYANTQVKYNPTYYQRRFLEFNDVDATTDEFLVYFKETYLKDIQFETNSNIRLLLKHTLDLYRSKGTPQSIALLFRIIFGTDAEIYYPGDDIFKLSDGVWKKPKYIEISLNAFADMFVGKQITGQTSRATAFVEKLVRRQINNRLIDVLYVTGVNGTFILGEKLNNVSVNLPIDECPIMIGSLTGIDVDENGIGDSYRVGDLINIYSPSGGEAIARVSAVVNTAGIVATKLVNGGYGYTSAPLVYVSDNVLTISDVSGTYSIYDQTYFDRFEVISQLYANVSYVAANGKFTAGSNVYTYYANNTLKGVGIVLLDRSVNSNVGSILISPLSGNVEANNFYSLGNTVGATVNVLGGYAWANATARVLSVDPVITIYTDGTYDIGTTITQNNALGIITASGTIASVSNLSVAGVAIDVNVTGGLFLASTPIYMANGNFANTKSVEISVAVVNTTSLFVSSGHNNVTGTKSQGTITSISHGTGAGVTVSPNLQYPETITINNTLLTAYMNMPIANTTYVLPGNTSGNLTNLAINAQMGFTTITVGKIAAITPIQGSSYTVAPVIKIIEPATYVSRHHDTILNITGGPSGFFNGELVTQSGTGARGLVTISNTSVLHIERLRYHDSNNFVVTTSSGTTIFGTASGATSNITSVTVEHRSKYLGINANLVTSLAVSNGSIAGMDVIESGYGFVNGEQLSIYNQRNRTGVPLFAFANVYTVGTGRGYYLKDGGFLSSGKKIYDGYYYQNYSYDVRSSVTLDKYKQMLKTVVHTAGTMLFGTFVQKSNLDIAQSFKHAIIQIS